MMGPRRTTVDAFGSLARGLLAVADGCGGAMVAFGLTVATPAFGPTRSEAEALRSGTVTTGVLGSRTRGGVGGGVGGSIRAVGLWT